MITHEEIAKFTPCGPCQTVGWVTSERGDLEACSSCDAYGWVYDGKPMSQEVIGRTHPMRQPKPPTAASVAEILLELIQTNPMGSNHQAAAARLYDLARECRSQVREIYQGKLPRGVVDDGR